MDRSDLKPLVNTAATIGPLWPTAVQVQALMLRIENARN